MENNEDKELCEKCGGICCKKCGCDHSPRDFEKLTKDVILEILDKGKTSVVAFLDIKKINNRIAISPVLYLRARNKGRDAIDLLSFKKTCSLLTDEGCDYSFYERPFWGRNLVPSETLCYPKENPQNLLKEWMPYQKVLSYAVKVKTGKSVNEKLKEDVVNLFLDIEMKNFEDVMKSEIFEILQIYDVLKERYSDEYSKAVEILQKSPKVRIRKQEK